MISWLFTKSFKFFTRMPILLIESVSINRKGWVTVDAYVARQPIFDKKKSVFGYELLFRDSMENFMPQVDGDVATSKLLSSSFFTMGFNRMVGDTKAFVNFTKNLLTQKIPLIFPSGQTVVEILEDVKPTADVIDACNELKAKGYVIALDDFICHPEMQPLVDLCDIIKIDFRAIPAKDLAAYIKPVCGNGVRLLAEKVETHDEFDHAVSLGFELFQGYFFSKPEIIKGKEISSSQMTILEIMAEANREEIFFDKIRVIIESDVAISYKLLRYINSAYYKRVIEVNSIKQALVLLGEAEIRRFISMIALAQLVTDKPIELIKASFIRAKFLDLISLPLNLQARRSELFTLGLFSMIDALLDQPMGAIMEKLPLSTAVVDALVRGEGELTPYLNLAQNYEKGDWQEVGAATSSLDIAEDKIPPIFLEACEWGTALARS